MIPIYEFDKLAPEQILNRDSRAGADVGAAVDAVLAEVRTRGTTPCGIIRNASTAWS